MTTELFISYFLYNTACFDRIPMVSAKFQRESSTKKEDIISEDFSLGLIFWQIIYIVMGSSFGIFLLTFIS